MTQLPQTRHGCTCNTCHWCTWESSPVDAIKQLLSRMVENEYRHENNCAGKRNFYRAEYHKGKAEQARDVLQWIERMEATQ